MRVNFLTVRENLWPYIDNRPGLDLSRGLNSSKLGFILIVTFISFTPTFPQCQLFNTTNLNVFGRLNFPWKIPLVRDSKESLIVQIKYKVKE